MWATHARRHITDSRTPEVGRWTYGDAAFHQCRRKNSEGAESSWKEAGLLHSFGEGGLRERPDRLRKTVGHSRKMHFPTIRYFEFSSGNIEVHFALHVVCQLSTRQMLPCKKDCGGPCSPPAGSSFSKKGPLLLPLRSSRGTDHQKYENSFAAPSSSFDNFPR